ncbi:hypothetical protein [Erythrobacter sp. MTPC3]
MLAAAALEIAIETDQSGGIAAILADRADGTVYERYLEGEAGY